MQSRLLVEVLPRESEVVFEFDQVPIRVFVRSVVAEGIAVPGPNDSIRRIGHHSRSTQVISVDVVDVCTLKYRDRSVI